MSLRHECDLPRLRGGVSDGHFAKDILTSPSQLANLRSTALDNTAITALGSTTNVIHGTFEEYAKEGRGALCHSQHHHDQLRGILQHAGERRNSQRS